MHFLLKVNILEDENFILWVLFMATQKQQTTNYKQIFWLVLLVFLGLLARWGYLKFSEIALKKSITSVQEKVRQEQAHLASFSDNPWFDKLQYVKDMEANNNMMPWSDHVNAIMAIFDELLAVDRSDTFNITFSDFEITLTSIRLHGYVTNLRILYQWANWQTGLITKFEELDFLDNISIKTYEKSSDNLGYEFVLTANVINNGK